MKLIRISRELTRLTLARYADPVRAGFPSPAADFQEEGLDFNELLVKNPSATFCLRVSGDSMRDAGISQGDILVVDRSLVPRNADIIVASLEGEFMVKRYTVKSGQVVLESANSNYPPVQPEEAQELYCFGVVTAVVKQLKP